MKTNKAGAVLTMNRPRGSKRAERRAAARVVFIEYHIPQMYFKNFWRDGATKEVAQNMLASIRNVEAKQEAANIIVEAKANG